MKAWASRIFPALLKAEKRFETGFLSVWSPLLSFGR